MGLIDDLISKVNSTLGGAAAPGATTTAVAEDHSALVKGLLELINSPQIGGLSGLVKRFQEKGLSSLMTSWIGTGPNASISPAQVQSVFGAEPLADLAKKSGLPSEAVSSKVATILPLVIDHLSPGGALPKTGVLEKALGWVKGLR